ncbi:MAG: alpha/beta fold hydrolase [Bacilli bacterium]
MQKINDLNINFIRYGKLNKPTIVFLHGWGQNIEMMKPIADSFVNDNDLLIIDLPGYGKSEEPKFEYTVYDYVEVIKKLCDDLKISNPILVGHSFGGKIALTYASKYKTEKLILFGSPFKKEIQHVSLKLKLLKQLKKIPGINKLENIAKKYIGSTDYRNATPIMRKILVNTVNLDITNIIKNITCPTLIIWGTNDEAVPLERAYELEKLIKNSAVIEYENRSHYAYLEEKIKTINILKSFIN